MKHNTPNNAQRIRLFLMSGSSFQSTRSYAVAAERRRVFVARSRHKNGVGLTRDSVPYGILIQAEPLARECIRTSQVGKTPPTQAARSRQLV
jgi:hypothetical protein